MSFSTSAHLPSTWPIESYSVELIGSIFKCPPEDALRRRTDLGKCHRDPAWIDATVAALSVPALCVVGSLASRGGMQHVEELERAVHATYGLDRDDVAGGIQELFKLLLVVPLTTAGRASILAMVASAADELARRVVGLELASAGSGSFVPDPATDGGRALLATTMALATADLRLTTAGAPHRAGLKKLAKQVGLEPAVLERLVISALDCRLVSVDEDSVLAPLFERLLAASEGDYAEVPTLDVLRASRSAVPTNQLDTFLLAARYREEAIISRESIEVLPGFAAGKVGKVAAIASVPIVGTAAASITPSFEVFLPPESRPRDLVEVLAACEVGRIDRAIVGRITKASINAAISRGASADSLIAALGAATRTPLPQNVVAAIRDWAGHAVTATVARGTTIVVAPSDEARAVGALASLRPRVVAPGVLVISDDVAERTIAVTLRKHGIFVGQPHTVDSSPPSRRPSASLDVLHGRLAAYRRRDPSEPRPAPPSLAPSSIAFEDATASHTLFDRIERWEAQCDEVFDPDLLELLVEVLEPLAFHDRQFIFGAASRDELLMRLGGVLSRPDQFARLTAFVKAELAGFGCPVRSSDNQLEWHHDHLLARLEAAVQTRSTMAIDLGTRTCTMAVTQIMPRGATLVILGEDAHATNHALRFDQIRAVAEASKVEAGAAKWRPVPGMRPPPGHFKCPCGSDKRYRECCREMS